MHPFSKRLILCDRTVEFGRREVLFGDERLRLSPLEAAALAYLSERPGQPVTREELLREVWGYAPQVRSRAADITISRLRQQIEADPRRPRHLVTVRGVGYRFEPIERSPTASAPPDRPPTPGRPPRPLGVLIGRAAELSALRAAAGRLVVIQGPPGVGKTRLVLAHAASLEERGQPVWWCALSEVRAAEGFEEALAQALGVPLSEEGSASEQIGYALAGRGAGTLLLDTFEHLPASCGVQLLGWLRSAPALRAVVTSRRRLGLSSEQLISLSGLPPAEAAALLQARAQQVGVRVT
ncbi:MAG: DNA-binding winged helix-turn-helix (wHTH) protein, partial [Myxococcota bacterium]